MRIAVYSGSFNPLHIGHQAIMEYLTREKKFDWVYLVVSPKNPLKEGISEGSGRERYLAAIQAVKRHPELHVWVDDIELNMDPPHYSIRTLDALRAREPDNEFSLVIGADNLDSIRKWRDFPRILTEYGVSVYPREGYDINQLKKDLLSECVKNPSPYVLDASENVSLNDGMRSLEEILSSLYNIDVIDAPMINMASTEIRDAISKGKDISKYLM